MRIHPNGAWLAVPALLLSVVVAQAAAPYRTLNTLPSKEERTLRNAKKSMLDGEVSPNADTLKKWYLYGRLAYFTKTPKDGRNLWQVRNGILTDLSSSGRKNEQVHAEVLRIVYDLCKKFLAPSANFSPIARYNAMLIIASLNEKEAVTTGQNQRPPTPHLGSLAVMLKELKSAEQVDAVRVACLIGILRHAELTRAGWKMPAKARDMVSSQALALATSECPDFRSKGGHEWMQRRGLEILGALGTPGSKGEVVQLLDGIIRDETASVTKRCSAIEALSHIKITSEAGIDIDKTTLALGTISVNVCRKVNGRLKDRLFEREANGGQFNAGGGGYGGGYGSGYGGSSAGSSDGGRPTSGYGGGGGGYGGGGGRRGGRRGGGGGGYDSGYGGGYGGAYGGDEEEEEEKVLEDPLLTEARRDLKYRLGCIDRGIKHVQGVWNKTRSLRELADLVNSLLETLDEEEQEAESFRESVRDSAEEIASLFGIEAEEEEEEELVEAPPAAAEAQPLQPTG